MSQPTKGEKGKKASFLRPRKGDKPPKNEKKGSGRKMSTSSEETISAQARTKTPVFGTPLQTLLALQKQQHGCEHLRIPFLIKECINYIIRCGLDTEGLFRISCDVLQLNKVKAEYNDQLSLEDVRELCMEKRIDNVHEATALFKQFLRELAVPVLTFQLAESFSQAMETEDHGTKIRALKEVLARLPEENRCLLHSVLSLLYIITCNATYNMMDSDNLSRLIGPNLLWAQAVDFSMELMVKVNSLTRFMIEHVDELFDAPLSSFGISNKHEPAILVRKFAGHVKSVLFLTRTFDRRYVWSADSRAVIRIYDTHALQQLKEIDTGAKNIYSIKDVEGTIWLGSAAGIQTRNAANGDLLWETPGPVYSIAHVENNVWTGSDQKIHVWSRECQKEGEIDIGVNVPVFSLLKVANTVWAACLDYSIRVIDIMSKTVVKQFPAHKKKINTMLALPNGQVWTCSDDATIGVWDSLTYQLLQTITGHNGYVYGLTLVGSRVWSCSWDKRILIWDTKTFERVDELPAYHNDAVSAVLECHAQKEEPIQVWSSSWDKSVIVWSVPNASEPSFSSLVPFDDHQFTVLIDVETFTQTLDLGSEMQPGVREALDGMLEKQYDVRLWLGSPSNSLLSYKLDWISQHLGEHWVERAVIAADRKLLLTDVVIVLPGTGSDDKARGHVVEFRSGVGFWENFESIVG